MLKFDHPTLVTLTAPTCSGKSVILNALTDRGCGRIVSTTTRYRRIGETEGVDYRYISTKESMELEEADAFFELINFRGTRYGVTHAEMEGKMAGEFAPVVVLEPVGLAIYEQKCREHGWNIYKVYISTPEPIRLNRLDYRTADDLKNADTAESRLKVLQAHTDRVLSITGDERLWQSSNIWDAVVPGTNLTEALDLLVAGAKWRNARVAEPKPYHHTPPIDHHPV